MNSQNSLDVHIFSPPFVFVWAEASSTVAVPSAAGLLVPPLLVVALREDVAIDILPSSTIRLNMVIELRCYRSGRK